MVMDTSSAFQTPEDILEGLYDDDEYNRWYAARAAGDAMLFEAIPRLVELLGLPCVSMGHTDVRAIAAWSLSKFGVQIMPLLEGIASSDNELARAGAADTLGLVGSANALPVLSGLLRDPSSTVRLWAALALSKVGPDASETLHTAYSEVSEETKLLILDALLKIGGESSELAAELADQASSKDFKAAFNTLRARNSRHYM